MPARLAQTPAGHQAPVSPAMAVLVPVPPTAAESRKCFWSLPWEWTPGSAAWGPPGPAYMPACGRS